MGFGFKKKKKSFKRKLKENLAKTKFATKDFLEDLEEQRQKKMKMLSKKKKKGLVFKDPIKQLSKAEMSKYDVFKRAEDVFKNSF